jgi:hypothetical protein
MNSPLFLDVNVWVALVQQKARNDAINMVELPYAHHCGHPGRDVQERQDGCG